MYQNQLEAPGRLMWTHTNVHARERSHARSGAAGRGEECESLYGETRQSGIAASATFHLT